MKKEFILFILFPMSQILIFLGNIGFIHRAGYRTALAIFISVIADAFILYYIIKTANMDKTEKN